VCRDLQWGREDRLDDPWCWLCKAYVLSDGLDVWKVYGFRYKEMFGLSWRAASSTFESG